MAVVKGVVVDEATIYTGSRVGRQLRPLLKGTGAVRPVANTVRGEKDGVHELLAAWQAYAVQLQSQQTEPVGSNPEDRDWQEDQEVA